jgi:hypothetical protein
MPAFVGREASRGSVDMIAGGLGRFPVCFVLRGVVGQVPITFLLSGAAVARAAVLPGFSAIGKYLIRICWFNVLPGV